MPRSGTLSDRWGMVISVFAGQIIARASLFDFPFKPRALCGTVMAEPFMQQRQH
jgi:hypothetical protein